MEREQSDVLYGVGAIAGHLGMTPNQARHRVYTRSIPTFKMTGSRIVCARRSTLDAFMADQERKAAEARSA